MTIKLSQQQPRARFDMDNDEFQAQDAQIY
jgi:hypothetical protein